MHPAFSEPLCFTEGAVQLLVVEQPVLFRQMVAGLRRQTQGEEGEFLLSKDFKPLECVKAAELIVDPFQLPLDSRRIQSKLSALLKRTAWQELQAETAVFLQRLGHYLQKLCSQVDLPLVFDDEPDIQPLIKAAGMRLALTGGSMAEDLLDYMLLCRDLCGIELFVLVGIKGYLDEKEQALLFDHALGKKLQLLLLEPRQPAVSLPCERVCLLDGDLCELRLEPKPQLE